MTTPQETPAVKQILCARELAGQAGMAKRHVNLVEKGIFLTVRASGEIPLVSFSLMGTSDNLGGVARSQLTPTLLPK